MRFHFKLPYGKQKHFLLEFGVHRRNTLLRTQEEERRALNVDNLSKRDYNKVFCVGFGKTGTTSLEKALKDFGFEMGNQAVAEILSQDWAKRRTDRIINFCYTADAFQDAPFGFPGLFKVLDSAFPNSKFILTVRDNESQWYDSLIRFHTKIWSSDKSRAPNVEDLAGSLYRYRGCALDMKKLFYNFPNIELYDEQYYKKQYLDHIKSVQDYFQDRDIDLLVINVAEIGSYQKLGAFLNLSVDENDSFPWRNRT
ncbi:MAG: hypothetical protein JRD93_12570 [Deltaproteobacteria bacterium]|nr:hypothetical protein [Deltaproteobacteria bacterium]